MLRRGTTFTLPSTSRGTSGPPTERPCTPLARKGTGTSSTARNRRMCFRYSSRRPRAAKTSARRRFRGGDTTRRYTYRRIGEFIFGLLLDVHPLSVCAAFDRPLVGGQSALRNLIVMSRTEHGRPQPTCPHQILRGFWPKEEWPGAEKPWRKLGVE